MDKLLVKHHLLFKKHSYLNITKGGPMQVIVTVYGLKISVLIPDFTLSVEWDLGLTWEFPTPITTIAEFLLQLNISGREQPSC